MGGHHARSATAIWFVDAADDDDGRRAWHRLQIITAARELGYFAGLGEFSSWVRLGLETEAGRGEIVLTFHTVGAEFRGIVGASLMFFRRSESGDGARELDDIDVVCDDVFQINYKEQLAAVEPRFFRWLERGLVRALETWRRGE